MFLKAIDNTFDFSNFKFLENIYPIKSGYFKYSSSYNTTYEIGDYVRMLYVSSGRLVVKLKTKSFPIKQNDIFFFMPNSRYTVISSQEGIAEVWWIDIQGSSIKAFLEALDINHNHSTLFGVTSQTLSREIKTIVTYYDNLSCADMFQIVGSFYKICAILLENYTTGGWETVGFSDQNMIYNGNWITWPIPDAKNQQEIYTADSKSFAEFNFFGSGIKWFGTMNFDCGIADVMIDQIYQASVDCYNPTRLTKQLLFSNTRLEQTNHIIKIFCTGRKNDKATNCDIVIESLQYIAQAQNNIVAGKQPDSKVCKKMLEMIKMNYASDICVEQIAQTLSMSVTSLNTKFKAETGVSVGTYIINYRMLKAKELLCHTGLSVSEIAGLVGYSDAFYFSRLFKKKENISPTEFRKTNSM